MIRLQSYSLSCRACSFSKIWYNSHRRSIDNTSSKARPFSLFLKGSCMKKYLKSLLLCLLVVMAVPTYAISLSADGLGQALIYPYYTARSAAPGNAYVTAISVVNTTAFAKAVKVRFIEGKNSREVLDFNLFLSPHDTWTAGIVAAGLGAGLFTSDTSCTIPVISKNPAVPVLFRNIAYVGDGGGDSLDRTYEGYFEILEMGSIARGSALEAAVVHVLDASSPNASKPSCAGLPLSDAVPSGLVAPTGGLAGAASIINVNEGTDYGYDAVALDNWSNQTRWAGPGTSSPKLIDASPAISVVLDSAPSGGRMLVTSWSNPRDAVSAVLMRSHVYNEYTVEAGIKAATDWVITFPTKSHYVNGLVQAVRPFQSSFGAQGSCDSIGLIYYDREEQTPGAMVDFSPTTPLARSLCYEANVVSFSANSGTTAVSNVLHSNNVANVPLKAGWVNGWADLSFTQDAGYAGSHSLAAPVGTTTITNLATGSVSPNQSVTYFGLPVVGFALQSYSTTGLPGVSTTVLSNYGGNFNHKYLRDIR